MLLSAALGKFITAKTAGGRSPRTIEKYQDITTRFIESRGDVELDDVTPEDLEDFLCKIREGHSPDTLLTYYQTLQTFFNWCHRRCGLAASPVEAIDKPRVPKRLPPFLHDDEVLALLRATHRMVNRLKAEAILRFMLDTGARAGEVVRLSREDIDLQGGTARLLGKDQQERIVHLGQKTIAAIQHYWEGRIDDYPAAFHGYEGTMKTAGLRSLIRRAASMAGIKRRCYLHLLRHTFAHNWIVGGGDVESLRRILGHSSLNTTQIYAGIDQEDIHRKHATIKPADKF
jgi:site-specific recombinase XerD